MKIKIIQPAGLGDILFCMKIAKELIRKGNQIYWPVISQYQWIGEYIKIPDLSWENPSYHDMEINLQSAGGIYKDIPIMDAKYKMVNMSYENWQEYVEFERNNVKEEELFNRLTHNKPYCLICENFASPPHPLRRYVEPSSDCENVYIEWIDGYNPFDWCKIIEGAEELRLVDTSYTHIIETLDLKAKKLKLYSRDGKFYTDHLWTKKWEYIV